MNRIVFVLHGRDLIPAFELEEGVFVLPSGKRKRGLSVFALSSVKGKFEPSNFKNLLKEAEKRVEDLAKEVDEELLWESIARPLTIEELAQIYFGESVKDERLAVLYRVLSSSIYFKRKGNVFVPRPQEEVQKLKEMERAERTKKERVEKFLKFVKEGGEAGEEEEEMFSLLRDYVIYEGQIPERALAEEVIKALGLRSPKGILSFLVRMGKWEEGREPLFEKLNLDRPFSRELILLERERRPEELGRIEDPIPALAIDEEETKEVDDAISLKGEGESFVVGIHVCDLASFIPADSELDREAQRRAQTIYLPERRYFMLPEELVEEKYTLSPQRPSRALSLYLKLTSELKIEKWWFSRTLLRIRRTSYQEAEEILLRDFPVLVEFFKKRQEARRRRGAILVNLPELEIKVMDGERVEIYKKDTGDLSHSLVQEAMILYNEKAAEFLAKTHTPAVYRTQPFDPGEVPQVEPSDPLYFLKIIPYLKASQLTTHPQPHLSLGVNYYTQATSPLRRYGDLVIQRQITHALGLSRVKYSPGELMATFEALEEKSHQIKELVRQRRLYWIMKYLSQRRGKLLLGYYSRFVGGRHMAFFPDLLLELPVSLPWNRPQRPGREFVFRVEKADPVRKTALLVLAT